ncbi:hypothetical protein [uncultured Polaribacter sp.]|uniref:hypothetical protein n=1 Tax=uncultured Polaribacter sp. TaxID=174711 RepID=UPI00263441C9|nr:hypothetical protein [uncultured Polaribacter sp.]
MKNLKRISIALGVFIIVAVSLVSCNVIWTSPSYYDVKDPITIENPIMDMETYEKIINTHRRPYIYSIKSSSGGEAHILGVAHTTDGNHPQFETIKKLWNEANPSVALVEGRLGFLFTWFQDPIKKYGEGGLVSQLTKKNGVDLFTWEPAREDEIELLMKEFPVEQIAMFYSFRPYFSNMRHDKPENPEKKLQEYLDSRTDYKHIRGIYKSWEELDRLWKEDFPSIDWRDYSDMYGWPEGYLSDIANSSNLARDYHMVQTIIELVNDGQTVFVTMGASHAPRIEKSLRVAITN